VLDRPGVERYARLLPVEDWDYLASEDDALRPVASPALAELLNVESVHLLPQTRNATGTFKDNEGVIVAAKCKEWRLTHVCMHSSGNTARSYQYYLDRVGIRCTGFVPQASAYKCPTDVRGACRIASVPGGMRAAADASIAYSEATGAYRLTPSAWKIEGKVPVGLAIAEHCSAATVIAVTIASGYGPLGMDRAFARLAQAGLAGLRRPRFLLAQAEDAAVISSAIHSGTDRIDLSSMVPPEKAFEPTLQSTNPNRTLPLIRALVERTGSWFHVADPDQTLAYAPAFERACSAASVPVDYAHEKSAFICWSAVAEAAKRGELTASDRVVLVVSG
jgi:threonine synthase